MIHNADINKIWEFIKSGAVFGGSPTVRVSEDDLIKLIALMHQTLILAKS